MPDNVSVHRRTWDVIPWVVNGTASDADLLAVEAHVQDCKECREELALQRRIQSAMSLGAGAATDAQRSWERFSARLQEGAQAAPRRRVAYGLGHSARWFAAAAVTVIGVFGLLHAYHSQQSPPAAASAAYRTLSAPVNAVPTATIRAVFSPTTDIEQLQVLLSGTGLTVVAGPSEAGVWALAPASTAGGDTTAALQRLRTNAAVRFAEPVGATR